MVIMPFSPPAVLTAFIPRVLSIFDMKLAVLATVATRNGKKITKSIGGIDTSSLDAPACIGRLLYALNIESMLLSNPGETATLCNSGMYGLSEKFYTRVGHQHNTQRPRMMQAYRAMQDLLEQCGWAPASRRLLILELQDVNKSLLSILSEKIDLRLKPKLPLKYRD